LDALIRELETLRDRDDVPNTRIVGAVIATATRCQELLHTRTVGLQALATAVAMQPGIDARKLFDDFMLALHAHYDSLGGIPSELKDLGHIIRLAAADREP
jgi:hypothetical protein